MTQRPVLLVLAYEDEPSYHTYGLKDALPLSLLRPKLPSMSKDDEIVFYCA